MRLSTIAVAAGLTLLLAACGSSSGGAGGSTSTGAGGAGGGGANACFDYAGYDGSSPAAHFQADVLPILRRSCGVSMSCHGAETAPAPGQHYYGPALSAPAPTADQIKAIFDQSVGQPSVDEPSMKVVAAGKPDQSFLMYKLDGIPSDGSSPDQVCSTLKCAGTTTCLLPMPQGGPQLAADERDVIRRWIAQGAKND